MARAASATEASVREWHVGPVFAGGMGYHQFVVEFLKEPVDLERFRDALDADLSRPQRRLPGPPHAGRGPAAAGDHRRASRAASNPGCGSAANWADKTRCHEWTIRACSPVTWSSFCVRRAELRLEVVARLAAGRGNGTMTDAGGGADALDRRQAAAGQAAAFF